MASRPNGQHEQLLKALIDIGQELVSTIDLNELLNRILVISREVFHFENAIIRLHDEKRGVLTAAASYGYEDEAVGREIPVGRGVMGKVASTGTPVLMYDLAEMRDYVPGISGARSELAVPMIARNRVVGVFNVESTRVGAFSDADVAPLMTMAGQAAIAIENARLYENLRTVSTRYQELHQFNNRILKSVNLGIYTVDVDMKITSWNQTIAEMSGVSESEAVGRNLFELFPALVEEGFIDAVTHVLETGLAEKVRLTHRNFKGDIRYQKRRLSPLKDGELTTGVVVIVEDVTDFKRLMDQTVQSEKLAEVGRMSAGIAHEINNPLSVISYGAQLLLREENLQPFQKEIVERVESEVDRLKMLTGGLLSFSKAQETRKRPTDLHELIRDVLRLVRYELTKHSVEIREEFALVPPVNVDPNKIKQVFINLILNASHAMPQGGVLTISTAAKGGDEIETVFCDTGTGMPEEVQEHIFEPFFSTKQEGKGTGLGLYICRNIVEEHQGSIRVYSSLGQGTSFRVALPVAKVLED